MYNSLEPDGYQESHSVNCSSQRNCSITVGFSKFGNQVKKFLVSLHYFPRAPSSQPQKIAEFDHNEMDSEGHNFYDEGVHVDVWPPNGKQKLRPNHNPIPPNLGVVIRTCVYYLQSHADYFIDVHKGNIQTNSPPYWG